MCRRYKVSHVADTPKIAASWTWFGRLDYTEHWQPVSEYVGTNGRVMCPVLALASLAEHIVWQPQNLFLCLYRTSVQKISLQVLYKYIYIPQFAYPPSNLLSLYWLVPFLPCVLLTRPRGTRDGGSCVFKKYAHPTPSIYASPNAFIIPTFSSPWTTSPPAHKASSPRGHHAPAGREAGLDSMDRPLSARFHIVPNAQMEPDMET